MELNKLADKIPDLYFDWYARFLPGAIGLIIYFILTFIVNESEELELLSSVQTTDNRIVLPYIYLGFTVIFIGLLQPTSSFLKDIPALFEEIKQLGSWIKSEQLIPK